MTRAAGLALAVAFVIGVTIVLLTSVSAVISGPPEALPASVPGVEVSSSAPADSPVQQPGLEPPSAFALVEPEHETGLEPGLAQHGEMPASLDARPGPAEAPAEEGEPASSSRQDCDRPAAPLPVPGSPGATEFWQTFRAPLPPAPVWNPPGRKHVGLQAGHWRVEEAPGELRGLGHGASGGGRSEWEVNLDIAQRAAELLRRAGVDVDILPATVPVNYRAHAFVSIHADGDQSGALRGYKLARAGFSATPQADDRLVGSLYEAYGETTGLPRDDLHISRRMTAYYAFNSRRYCHAIAPGTPGAIIETGFLTSAVDRQLLLGNPNAAARGIATGLLRFLGLPE